MASANDCAIAGQWEADEQYFERLSLDLEVAYEETMFSRMRSFFKHKIFPHLTRKFFAVIIFSQFLSLLLCTAGVATQELVLVCHVKFPAFQSFLSYLLLSLVFTSVVAYKSQETMQMVKERWWKYIIIGIIDFAGNYLVFRAYQYTSLTSVQLLDCLSIPVVVILSIAVLKARYKLIHFFGIFTCLVGMGFLVWADSSGSRNQGPSKGNSHRELLGDVLVIGGAVCFGMSNVAEEYVVKTSSTTEFLGMMTFFASFVSAISVIIFERDILAGIVWNYRVVLLLAASVLSMFLFYILMPLLIGYSSATLVNLTLLTADLYSLFAGRYLFNFKFSHLYVYSFVIIVVGVLIFKVFPTPSRVDQPSISNNVVNDEADESLVHSS